MSLEDITRSLTGRPSEPVMRMWRRYPAAPAEIWPALTRPERLARWLGVIEGTVDGVGSEVRVRFADAPDRPAEARVERCDANERLVVSWQWAGEARSTVTVDLAADAGGTLLSLEHRLGEPDHVAAYGGGWEQCLTDLTNLFGRTSEEESAEAAATDRWHALSRHPLSMEVDLDADLPTVWRALTTVEGLRAWWWNHWDDVEIAADARPGGAYRFAAPGAGIAVEGVYLDVEAEEHLSFTWRWIDADGRSADEACDLRLSATDGGSRLALRHTGPWSDEAPADSYRQGWDFVFAALARVVA